MCEKFAPNTFFPCPRCSSLRKNIRSCWNVKFKINFYRSEKWTRSEESPVYMYIFLCLKLPGWDGSWMGDYATCGSCHLVHTARFTLAPHLLQRYDRWVSHTNSAGLLVYYIQARRSLSSRCTNFKANWYSFHKWWRKKKFASGFVLNR